MKSFLIKETTKAKVKGVGEIITLLTGKNETIEDMQREWEDIYEGWPRTDLVEFEVGNKIVRLQSIKEITDAEFDTLNKLLVETIG